MIWLATHRTTLGSDRAFFGLLWAGLVTARSEELVQARFRALSVLCRLPWLDQPRRLDAVQLQGELFEAWDELCTVAIHDLAPSGALKQLLRQPMRFDLAGAGARLLQVQAKSAARVGQVLQFPISEIAAAVAGGIGRGSVRVATHRSLIAGSAMQQLWRVVQGGRTDVQRSSDPRANAMQRMQPRAPER